MGHFRVGADTFFFVQSLWGWGRSPTRRLRRLRSQPGRIRVSRVSIIKVGCLSSGSWWSLVNSTSMMVVLDFGANSPRSVSPSGSRFISGSLLDAMHDLHDV